MGSRVSKPVVVRIPKQEVEHLQKAIDGNSPYPGYGECDVIQTWTAAFPDGCQADIKVCNGDNGPWIDPVLFDENGCEIQCLSPCYRLASDYCFDDDHCVKVVRS